LKKYKAKMDKYIVISPHTSEDCKTAVKQFRKFNSGFLTHFEWGCMDNDHTAYAIIEAENHESARMTVPPLFREKTRVVKLANFDPMQTEDPFHK
jgi:hypothetical protein